MPDNACVCCGKTIPEGRQVCRSCEVAAQKMGLLNKPAVVTNGDRIRAMDNEMLAEFFVKIIDCCSDGFMCDECPLDCAGGCYKPDIMAWLDKEASP